MQLRPEHMRLIAPAINLDYKDDIETYKTTIPKQLICDERFGY